MYVNIPGFSGHTCNKCCCPVPKFNTNLAVLPRKEINLNYGLLTEVSPVNSLSSGQENYWHCLQQEHLLQKCM